MTVNELKPCPLCISNEIQISDLGVLCKCCGLFLGNMYRNGVFTEAVKRWNRRVA